MGKVKIGVKIMPREVILDTQGRAVESLFKAHQFQIPSCRVGKYIELEFEGSEASALEEAKKACEFVLYNPLIETYSLEVLSR
jgi:phosphoribosylformylglycinamidine synthase PurS subunit